MTTKRYVCINGHDRDHHGARLLGSHNGTPIYECAAAGCNAEAEPVTVSTDPPPLTMQALRAAIATINRRANLIVHPDDEHLARDALDQLPEDVRPKLVVSEYLPGPGTAYFSRSVPIEHLTIQNLPRGTFLDRDEIADLANDIEAWGKAYADDRTPLYLPSGELVAGERAARYRRLRRRIANRVDIEIHGESPPIDPLDLLAADHVHLEEE